jgi:hypothetical protein
MSREDVRKSPSQKGLGEVKGVSIEREFAEKELQVTVLSQDVTMFERFVNEQYDIVDMRWSSYKSTETPVTRDEFLQYAYTAVRSRVARVRNERFHIRCDSEWQLVTGLASMLAQIGRVTLTAPSVTILPRWNDELDGNLITREKFLSISQKLRMMANDPDCKFVFADAISGDRSGDPVLMALIPVREDDGRIKLVRGQKDFDAIAGVSFFILDLDPEGIDGSALDNHPLLLPPYLLRMAVVMQYMTRYAEVSVG